MYDIYVCVCVLHIYLHISWTSAGKLLAHRANVNHVGRDNDVHIYVACNSGTADTIRLDVAVCTASATSGGFGPRMPKPR